MKIEGSDAWMRFLGDHGLKRGSSEGKQKPPLTYCVPRRNNAIRGALWIVEANHPTLPPLHPGVGCSYFQGDPEVSSFERSPGQELWMWAAGHSALLTSSPGISNGDGSVCSK